MVRSAWLFLSQSGKTLPEVRGDIFGQTNGNCPECLPIFSAGPGQECLPIFHPDWRDMARSACRFLGQTGRTLPEVRHDCFGRTGGNGSGVPAEFFIRTGGTWPEVPGYFLAKLAALGQTGGTSPEVRGDFFGRTGGTWPGIPGDFFLQKHLVTHF